MRTRLPSFARLAADRSGASVVELALIMPVLTLLVLGALDLGMGFTAKLKLQTAADRAIQLANSGGLNSAAYQAAAAEAASAANVPQGNVTVTSWLECSGVVQASTSDTCSSGQQVARFLSVTVTGSYFPMFTQVMTNTRWSANGVPISGSASVRLQ